MTPTPHLTVVPSGGIDATTAGSSIRALLRIADRTQASLGEDVGMDQPKLSKIVNGKRGLQFREASQIASSFGVPVTILELGGEEIKRRALSGLLVTVGGPDGGADLPVQSSPCKPNVVALRPREEHPASPVTAPVRRAA